MPPIRATRDTFSGRASAATHANAEAAECPTTSARPSTASTAASTAATWSSKVASVFSSPWPGRVSGTGRWPSFSSSGTTASQAEPSSHMPAISTMSTSVLLRCRRERVQVALGVEPVVPFLVDHDEQTLGQREVLEPRPPRLETGDRLPKLLGGQRSDHVVDHGLPFPPYGEDLVQRRTRLSVPGDAVPAGCLVPGEIERVPGQGVAERHPADPGGAREVEVAQRLDEGPLAADLLVQELGKEGSCPVLGVGPQPLEDRPRLLEPLDGGRVHLGP